MSVPFSKPAPWRRRPDSENRHLAEDFTLAGVTESNLFGARLAGGLEHAFNDHQESLGRAALLR